MKIKALPLFAASAVMLTLLSGCSASGSVKAGVDGRSAGIEGTVDIGSASTTQALSNGNPKITEAEAKRIALEHVNLTEDQVTGMRVHYDGDDPVPEYDVDFYNGGWEYDFEIHAETGKILSFEKDD